MNYTKWINQKFPSTKDLSSAETYKLIEQAKRKTRVLEFFLTLVFTTSAIYCSFYLGELYSAVPFEDILGWCNILFCLALAFSIRKYIIDLFIKSNLKKRFA